MSRLYMCRMNTQSAVFEEEDDEIEDDENVFKEA
ncbi:hypothetical protein CAL7102_03984 [Dulcicalothrix desertica PCC 7102]|nr:hypothetical protein CAL7102_03984 [Dulcicalothrix desertica PCC 7102]